MPIVKFKLQLYDKSFDELDNYSQDKIKKLQDGAAFFPSCQTLVMALKIILVSYTDLINNQTSTKADRVKRDKLRAEIEDLLTRIATYCALDCADVPENFPLSGLTLPRQQAKKVARYMISLRNFQWSWD